MNIFGVPVGADGCGYYRCYLPLTQLKRHGHDVSLPTTRDGSIWLPEAWHLGDVIDVVAGQCISGPSGMALWEEWAPHAKLVYDIDDDIFSVDYQASQWFKRPELVTVAEYLLHLSDVVTVSTPTLAEIMSKFNDNVIVLPNYVNAGLLDIERPKRDRVTIGWTPSPSHGPDAAYVAPMLRRFLRRNPKVDFHVMGWDYRAEHQLRGRHTPWAPDLWDYYKGIDFDIGIAPLADSRFNRSKSHLKALEYAALGIPVVAQDMEPYREFVLDGTTGFLVKNEHDWGRRLYELVNDEPMRAEMGAKAKAHAAAFTIQGHWQEWENAYCSNS